MAGRHVKCLRCNSEQGWLGSGKLWLLTFVRRFLCAHVAANITPTEWLGGELHLPQSTTIPHGLETTEAAPRLEPRRVPPILAFQGRLVTTKGVRILFEAARILREQGQPLELLIIGDGPERDSLERFAREAKLDVQVRFAGRLDGAQLNAALAQSSVVVVPSLGGEVFGLVVAENMLRALAVVASDLGAFVEVLPNQDGGYVLPLTRIATQAVFDRAPGRLKWAARLDPLSPAPDIARYELAATSDAQLVAARALVRRQPRSVAYQYLYGEALAAARRPDAARAALLRALALHPGDRTVRRALRGLRGQ